MLEGIVSGLPADDARRAPLLQEAAALLDATPPTLRGLHDIRLWRGLIGAAQRGS